VSAPQVDAPQATPAARVPEAKPPVAAQPKTATAGEPPAAPPEAPVAPPPSAVSKTQLPARALPKSIREVRRLYVEEMPNALDDYIRAELARQMPDVLAVVFQKSQADAIMKGTAAESGGAGSRVTGGYLGLKDKATGAVSICDVGGTVQLWASAAGDKAPVIGVVSGGGPKKVAERLVGNLKKAMSPGK
jgi:hypothetical protein